MIEALKERLDELRRAGKTRQQIAEEFGVTLYQVKRWIVALDVVGRKTKREGRDRQKVRETGKSMSPDEGVSLMDKAKQILGKRVGEDHRGYLLDGRPANSWAILKVAKLCPDR